MLSRMQFVVIDNFWYVPSESVVTNAVDQVLGECQISMATYLRGYLPSYKVVLQCIEN